MPPAIEQGWLKLGTRRPRCSRSLHSPPGPAREAPPPCSHSPALSSANSPEHTRHLSSAEAPAPGPLTAHARCKGEAVAASRAPARPSGSPGRPVLTGPRPPPVPGLSPKYRSCWGPEIAWASLGCYGQGLSCHSAPWCPLGAGAVTLPRSVASTCASSHPGPPALVQQASRKAAPTLGPP